MEWVLFRILKTIKKPLDGFLLLRLNSLEEMIRELYVLASYASRSSTNAHFVGISFLYFIHYSSLYQILCTPSQ